MTDMAEPQSSNRTWLSRPLPPGPSSRWMIDGSDGEALTRKGNSSITTGTGRSLDSPNRNWIASIQSRSGGTGDPVKRISSSVNSRSETASVT